jgi:threonine dehydratase
MAQPAIDRARIEATERLIRPHIRQTPVIEIAAADFGLPGTPILFKLEGLQHTGSFKPRGAFANLLTREVGPAGVAAASGGNHGVAVAYAAMRLGHAARIFVPEVVSRAKAERIRAYGAQLVIAGERYADALEACDAHVARTHALSVHAFDQNETLLGQGTLGLELDRQGPGFDTLMVAVGGGGLIAGIAAWFDGAVRMIGVEPEAAPTLHDALAAGHPVDSPAGGIAAESLAPRRVGALVLPIAQHRVERVVLVPDAAILAAQAALWSVLRIVAEPGGAAAFAALLSGAYRPAPDERVAVLVCGANTDAVAFGSYPGRSA